MLPGKTVEAVRYTPPQSSLSIECTAFWYLAKRKVLLASIVINLIPVLGIFWCAIPSELDFPAVEVLFITIFAFWILLPYATSIFLALWLNEKRVARWTVLVTSILSCLVSVGCLNAAFTVSGGGYYFVMLPIILFPFLLTGFSIALVAWLIENRKETDRPEG